MKEKQSILTVDDGYFLSTTYNPFDRHRGQGGYLSIDWRDEAELQSNGKSLVMSEEEEFVFVLHVALRRR